MVLYCMEEINCRIWEKMSDVCGWKWKFDIVEIFLFVVSVIFWEKKLFEIKKQIKKIKTIVFIVDLLQNEDCFIQTEFSTCIRHGLKDS